MAQTNVGPTICISSSPGGCTGNPADELIIDAGVTVVMKTEVVSQAAEFCVYSTLENYGTIIGGSFCDYGTIVNYGTIIIPVRNFFDTLPYNGFGILDNEEGGVIKNYFNFIDGGTVVNNGTIYNFGQFGNDNQYNTSLTGIGQFVGSAPCFSTAGCLTLFGLYNITASGTFINQMANGILLTITGASGTDVAIFTQNQTNAAPTGLGSLNVSSAMFYDIMIDGITDGTANVCVTNGRLTQNMEGGMQYWNGTNWANAANQIVLSFTETQNPSWNFTKTGSAGSALMLCGDIPVAALNGTPIGVGSPSSSGLPTTSTGQTTTTTTTTTIGIGTNLELYAGLSIVVLVVVVVFFLLRPRPRPRI